MVPACFISEDEIRLKSPITCFFWKNRKVGCSLGSENCYYLAEVVKTEQEKNVRTVYTQNSS